MILATKGERIAELLVIISNKSGRIKKLKLECGRHSTQICVLNLRIKELEADRAKLVENNDLLHEYIEQNRITQLVERIKELEGYKEGARDCLQSAGKRIKELEVENDRMRGCAGCRDCDIATCEQALKGGE